MFCFNFCTYADEKIELPTTPVTANPMGVSSDEFVMPISILSGKELNIQRGINLAETLSNTPGISFSNWGPSVARPVIRGLDSDRIRILQNGINFLDVSGFSADHAVPIDPLIIEQIDVIRGPATLIYGGGAVGGVVNAIDHRLPKEAVNGVYGRAETRVGGYNSERSSAVVMDVGNEQFAIHVDAYTKTTGNLEIPGYAVSKRLARSDSDVSRSAYGKNKLTNSGQDTEGGAIGFSYFLDKGYTGFSYSDHNSKLGNPLELGGQFDLNVSRWDWHTELHDLDGFFNHFKLKAAYTDYAHKEIESNGQTGSQFLNKGLDTTLELGHHQIIGMSGVVGLQIANTNFRQPTGDSLFPGAHTFNREAYIYEELPITEHKLTFGFRRGQHEVTSGSFTGDAGCTADFTGQTCADVGTVDNFSLHQTQKIFQTNNFSLGGIYKINSSWSLASNLSHNERAPAYFELFPYGHHHATETVQKGSLNLDTEKSNTIDLQLRWKNNRHAFNIGPYYTKFNNYVGMFKSGDTRYFEHAVGDVEGLDVYTFRQVGATFKGLEFDGQFTINDQYSFLVRGDYVRATQDNGSDLPRISPFRIGSGIDYQYNRFNARIDLLHAFAQENTEANELKSDSYNNLTAYGSYKLPIQYNLEIFAKGYNLLNEEIRDHASLMKDKIPLGGRSILFGVRGEF
ncbi:MAG: TonB-dependent receptor [Nitrosomonadales bacterium]